MELFSDNICHFSEFQMQLYNICLHMLIERNVFYFLENILRQGSQDIWDHLSSCEIIT